MLLRVITGVPIGAISVAEIRELLDKIKVLAGGGG